MTLAFVSRKYYDGQWLYFSVVQRLTILPSNEIALGVVSSIVPFNFPVMVPLWTLSVAIVMGTDSQL